MGLAPEHSNEIISQKHPLVFFDGVCDLCTGGVQFFIKRDPEAKLRFTSLQSQLGQSVLKSLGLSQTHFNSFLFQEKGQIYQKSTAFLMACRYLKGLWPILYLFLMVPRFFRDWVYDLIAQNRYKWFGKREECWLPTPEIKSRFIE